MNRHLLSQFEEFRLFTTLCLVILVGGSLAYTLQGTKFQIQHIYWLASAYYEHNLWQFCVTIIMLLLIQLSLDTAYHMFVRRAPLLYFLRRRTRLLRRVHWTLFWVLLVPSVLLSLPLAAFEGFDYANAAIPLSSLLLSGIGLLIAYPRRGSKPIGVLSQFRFENGHFNMAALSPQSEEVLADRKYYLDLRLTPLDPRTRAFLAGGLPTPSGYWKGLPDLFIRIGNLLDIDPRVSRPLSPLVAKMKIGGD